MTLSIRWSASMRPLSTPVCEARRVPKVALKVALKDAVVGQQSLGVNLVSLIATLREEGRLPFRTIQWYLKTVHQLDLSVGGIVQAIHGAANRTIARQYDMLGDLDRNHGNLNDFTGPVHPSANQVRPTVWTSRHGMFHPVCWSHPLPGKTVVTRLSRRLSWLCQTC